MFKNKVNIVEAHYPPTNENDWWFDLNTHILKRYYTGEWKRYDTPPPININMPADNEIWLRYTGEYSEDAFSSYMEEHVPGFNGSWDVKGDVIIVTDNDVKNILTGENYFTPSVNDEDFMISSIKLPKVNILGAEMENPIFSSSIDWIIIQDINYIKPYVVHSGPGIICLADTPPQVSYDSFGDSPYEVNVYVKDELVNTYKNDTNWCDYTIKPISELDQSIYNWG